MSEMELARFNIFWFLGLAAPAVIMLYATSQNLVKVSLLAALVSIIATYFLAVLACDRKWALRVEYVTEKYDLENNYLAEPMPEEAQRAFADGANMIFTGILLAPIEALLATIFWYAVGNGWQRKSLNRKPQDSEPILFNDQY